MLYVVFYVTLVAHRLTEWRRGTLWPVNANEPDGQYSTLTRRVGYIQVSGESDYGIP
jgi:hypothetical protein